MAAHGFQTILVKMPWRMATKGYKRPLEWHLLEDSTKQYILAGHSQGAKMAARLVFEQPDLIDGLILLGTTHPRDFDLSGSTIPILKISGANDGVADPESIQANKSKLPVSTTYVDIPGANHVQFGYYSYQLGDHQATISREMQQKIVLEQMLLFLKAN